MADGPLEPREQALGLWTGREVLFFGGSDAPPCPPNASCARGPTALSDGAALDPATGRWRRLADSPVPLAGVQGVVIGSSAYLLLSTPRRELLVYHIDRDSWARLPAPFSGAGGYQLAAAGDRPVVYRGSDEAGSAPHYLFEPRTGAWTALPEDPLGDAFDRHLAWSGRELLLFDHERVPNPNSGKPSLTRAAALDLGTRAWRRLPDLPMLSTGPWLPVGGTLVNPLLGGEDGGQVGGWGRTYPYGGQFDPATGAWSPLPDLPGDKIAGGGARAGDAALYPGLSDVVLDAATGRWQQVPAMPGSRTHGSTVLAAGARMVVFGGAVREGASLALIGTTWIWTPE
ncbi:hypothetical protein [Paractinoplanes maris]|uniref:hypothetical protein n=1 Tax=Paractinoplanes maris TaxID=1734446 RepID=UPI002020B0A7|nr:hypothetical protein [Actinoplanes maris]